MLLANTEPRNAEAMAERLVLELAKPFDLGGVR